MKRKTDMKKRPYSKKLSFLIAELIILMVILLNLFSLYHNHTKEAEVAKQQETEEQKAVLSQGKATEQSKADASSLSANALSENTVSANAVSEQAETSTAETTASAEKSEQDLVYSLFSIVDIPARQGICASPDYYYVSSSKSLAKYDKNWNLVAENTEPFAAGYDLPVNHIGDLDISGSYLYCVVEKFSQGRAENKQIALYDADTLQLISLLPIDPESGQAECAGICVNEEENLLLSCEWGDSESASYLYKYDLSTGAFLGRIYMENAPSQIQGIAYYDGNYYISADDGDADKDQEDHIYKLTLSENGSAYLHAEKGIAEVARQGEIEGLSFDESRKQLLVLYNYGQRIVNGVKYEFYDGYREEQHKIYLYSFHNL